MQEVQNYLWNLLLSSFTEKYSCTIGKALKELRDAITKFAPQGSRSHKSEKYKAEFLYDAAMTEKWAQNALTQCYRNTTPWNFQQIRSVLDFAWLQHQTFKEKSSHEYDTQKKISENSNHTLWGTKILWCTKKQELILVITKTLAHFVKKRFR